MIELKKLLENLSKSSYSDDTEKYKLSKEEKRKLYESVKAYNTFRENLKLNKAYESIKKINEIIQLAEKYALNESQEWMESKMIQDDFKGLNKLSEAMCKEINKLQESERTVEMLYERIGVQLERYFEIDDIK